MPYLSSMTSIVFSSTRLIEKSSNVFLATTRLLEISKVSHVPCPPSRIRILELRYFLASGINLWSLLIETDISVPIGCSMTSTSSGEISKWNSFGCPLPTLKEKLCFPTNASLRAWRSCRK